MAELEKFNLECLERVNELRRQFRVPPVKLRYALIRRPSVIDGINGAQDWADKLAKSDNLMSDEDAPRSGIGESICRLFSEKFCTFSGRAVISTWFDEAIEYKGLLSEEKMTHPVNFLQLIWSRTRYCGFGFAVSPKTSAMYTVARYKPMLPTETAVLVNGANQQVLKFEMASGSNTAFKSTISANLSQDVSYVKRNLCCSIPDSVAVSAETVLNQSGRFRLVHLVRQTRVTSRICQQHTGYVYVNDQVDSNDNVNDTFIIMKNEE